jgi:hypothetical protein
LTTVAALLVLGTAGAVFTWYNFFRDVPQPEWITGDPRSDFLYGSVGAERDAGIPYWIIVTLPRIFKEYLPGPGGYASLGLPWEEGKELPIGFSVKTIGFKRVGFNCALCHVTRYRTREDETPTYVAAGGNHTADIQGLLGFLNQSANDPRFNSKTILTEIDFSYPLGFVERSIYKFLIPATQKILRGQGEDFAWAETRPDWGPGRDAPMNLTKFNFLGMDDDGSVDNTDFPSIWNLKVREDPPYDEECPDAASGYPKKLNLTGDTPVVRSVIIDSALGLSNSPISLGTKHTDFFHRRVEDLVAWLKEVPPPPWPESLPLDRELAAHGEGVFRAQCAECHATDEPGNRMGTIIPIDEVGTDRERMDTWTYEAADLANEKTIEMDFRPPFRCLMEKNPGYIAIPLDGLWLNGPFLHNGSVATVRDLLEPPENRPAAFYRGYDLVDAENVGFATKRCPTAGEEAGSAVEDYGGACADRVAAPGEPCVPAFVNDAGELVTPDAWCLDTAVRGNGNGGHLFGTDLSADDKEALIEFLKTL